MRKSEVERLAGPVARKMEWDHFGEANATSADDLVEYLSIYGEAITDRDLRTIIKYARAVLRHPIISTFSGGYCYATGWEDDAYEHCKAQRKKVIRSNADAINELDLAMLNVYGPPRLFYPAGAPAVD